VQHSTLASDGVRSGGLAVEPAADRVEYVEHQGGIGEVGDWAGVDLSPPQRLADLLRWLAALAALLVEGPSVECCAKHLAVWPAAVRGQQDRGDGCECLGDRLAGVAGHAIPAPVDVLRGVLVPAAFAEFGDFGDRQAGLNVEGLSPCRSGSELGLAALSVGLGSVCFVEFPAGDCPADCVRGSAFAFVRPDGPEPDIEGRPARRCAGPDWLDRGFATSCDFLAAEPVIEVAAPDAQVSVGQADAARSAAFLPPVIERGARDLQFGA
jgi:hypothetical protein